MPTLDDEPNSQATDFQGMLNFLESEVTRYMHAREVLSTISESTQRRHSKGLPKQPRLLRDETKLLHEMVAVFYAYEFNAIAAASAGADFASGLLAFSACEVLVVMNLIHFKTRAKATPAFKKLWTKFRAHRREIGKPATYVQFVLEGRGEELFRIAKQAGIYEEFNLSIQVKAVLQDHGFAGQLSRFVRESRNAIHPRTMLRHNNRYARIMQVSYSTEAIKSFHADFALCAWELHGKMVSTPEKTQQGESP